MNKCSYYNKFSQYKTKNKEKEKVNKNIDENSKNNIKEKDYEEEGEDYFNKDFEEKKDKKKRIIKSGVLKKKGPYFYYDLRKVIWYDTPGIDHFDPEKSILKGSINLNKECSALLIKNNQFKLITPQRTYIFMCKERYDLSPWDNAINKAIKKYRS